jgi:putative endopeptidase
MSRNSCSWLLLGPFVALAGSPSASSPVTGQDPLPTTHGIDVAGMDRSTKPGDDFFKFANGSWDKNTPIPPDRASWGLDPALSEQATRHTRELLESTAAAGQAAGSDERKAADYYAAFMNEASIETRGLSALKSTLDRIAGLGDRRALAREFGSTLRADVDPINDTDFQTDHLFGLFVAQDFNEPNRNAAYLLQGGLAMPDREYYLAESPKMTETRTKYSAHVIKVLELAGIDDARTKAQRIVALETRIARVHAPREESEDVHKPKTWARADFDAKAPGLDWAAYFQAAGLDEQRAFIVWHPGAITGESALVASEPIDTWRDYLSYITLNHWSGLLPKAFADGRWPAHRRCRNDGNARLPRPTRR